MKTKKGVRHTNTWPRSWRTSPGFTWCIIKQSTRRLNASVSSSWRSTEMTSVSSTWHQNSIWRNSWRRSKRRRRRSRRCLATFCRWWNLEQWRWVTRSGHWWWTPRWCCFLSWWRCWRRGRTRRRHCAVSSRWHWWCRVAGWWRVTSCTQGICWVRTVGYVPFYIMQIGCYRQYYWF